jgi:hypothetical protein
MNKINKNLKYAYSMFDSGDAWGRCMAMLFSVADYLNNYDMVPAEWNFQQSPFGPDVESAEYQEIKASDCTNEEILHFGNVLFRLSNILIAQGKDY